MHRFVAASAFQLPQPKASPRFNPPLNSHLTKNNKSNKGGGQHLDLAGSIRNWGWYEIVTSIANAESKLSLREMDSLLLGEDSSGSKNILGDMRWQCRSPKKRLRQASRATVYDRVHADSRFEDARRWFESGIWETLSTKNLTEEDYGELVEKRIYAFNEENLTNFSKSSIIENFEMMSGFHFGLTTQLEPVTPVPLEETGGIASVIPRYFDEMRPIEEVDMYAALYRRLHFSHPKVLEIIRHWLAKGVESLMLVKPFHEHPNPEIGQCLKQLIIDRVLLNRWREKKSFLAHCEKESKNPHFEDHISWYMSVSTRFGLPAISANGEQRSKRKPKKKASNP